MPCFHSLVFGLLTGLGFGFVAIQSVSAIQCWECTNTNGDNEGCSEIAFLGEEVENKIKQRDCCELLTNEIGVAPIESFLPSGEPNEDPYNIFPSVTSCFKSVVKLPEESSVVIIRSCASPDIYPGKCELIKSPDGKLSTETCVCEGDLCNGSITLRLTPTILPIFVLLGGYIGIRANN